MAFQFNQGDIVWFTFPAENPKPQFTINGQHPALVLHDYSQPNQTVIISPLSSLHDKNGNEKELKSYHLKLLKRDYPELDCDSFVKLDQIMTFSRNKVTGSHVCTLNEKDMASTHLKLIESLQMHETIREITTIQLEKMVDAALERYIEKIIKDTSENK